jgi:hypothetical protein
MAKFVETVLKHGPIFMESAERNPKGAVVLLVFVLLVLGTLALALTLGTNKIVSALLAFL